MGAIEEPHLICRLEVIVLRPQAARETAGRWHRHARRDGSMVLTRAVTGIEVRAFDTEFPAH